MSDITEDSSELDEKWKAFLESPTGNGDEYDPMIAVTPMHLARLNSIRAAFVTHDNSKRLNNNEPAELCVHIKGIHDPLRFDLRLYGNDNYSEDLDFCHGIEWIDLLASNLKSSKKEVWTDVSNFRHLKSKSYSASYGLIVMNDVIAIEAAELDPEQKRQYVTIIFNDGQRAQAFVSYRRWITYMNEQVNPDFRVP